MQGQTLQNPTYGTVKLKTNLATASSSKIVSQDAVTGDLNYINAVNLPIQTAVLDSLANKANNTLAGIVSALGYTPENTANKQNSLINDGTGVKFTTVDAVNAGLINKENYRNQSPRDVQSKNGVFMIIGDSFTTSTGATSYLNGLSNIVTRSVLNASHGFGYASSINMASEITGGVNGITTTGSFSATGAVSSRLQLTAGQTITITGKNAKYFDVVYDGAVSSGNLEFRLNGVLINTKTISGASLNTTFPTVINGSNTLFTDTVTITSTGTVFITSILTLKEVGEHNLPFILGKSGTAYQDYTSSTVLDEIAFYLNMQAGKKTVVLALGTNNLYSGGKSLTPTNTIVQAALVIAGIKSRCTDVDILITIPAKSNEAVYPIIAGGFTYQNYVDSILDYCNTNGYIPIRYDKTQLGTGNTAYLADNVHPNNLGHQILANKINETLGVSTNKENISVFGLNSILGTASQVLVTTTLTSTTLSLPQSIAISSTPTFADLTLSGKLSVGTAGSQKINITGALGSNLFTNITNGTQTLLIGVNSSNRIIMGANSNHDVDIYAGGAARVVFYSTGNVGIITAPTTSASTYDILTRNTGTGLVEKVTSASVAPNLLTGYTSVAGTVLATDTVLQGIQKLGGNQALKADILSPTFTGDPKVPTPVNTTSIANKSYVDTALALKSDIIYKSYQAVVTQSSTGAPVATVFHNDLASTPTWSRAFTGDYYATFSTGVLTSGKSVVLTSGFYNPAQASIKSTAPNTTTARVLTINSAGSTADDILQGTYIEIRVYN